MNNTSLGYHTLSIYMKLTVEELRELQKIFGDSKDVYFVDNQKNKSMRYPKPITPYTNINYRQKYKGLSWALAYRNSSPEYMRSHPIFGEEDRPCSISAKINPKYLIGCHDDYIAAADSSCLNRLVEVFNYEARKISPMLKDFNSYSLNRIDYCVNFDLAEMGIDSFPEIYMPLIKRADIPYRYEERKEYVKDVGEGKYHRKIPGVDSFYLTNRSVHINCYNKSAQMERKDPNNPNIGWHSYILRFEVQYLRSKIYQVKKQFPECDTLMDLMSILLSDEYCRNVLTTYYNKTIGAGDYYNIDGARRKVKSMSYNRDKEDRLIRDLEFVNKYRGIHKAKSHLTDDKLADFKRSLGDLGEIGVNPVTIPRDCRIRHLPNLITTYLDQREKQEAAWAAAYPKNV